MDNVHLRLQLPRMKVDGQRDACFMCYLQHCDIWALAGIVVPAWARHTFQSGVLSSLPQNVLPCKRRR